MPDGNPRGRATDATAIAVTAQLLPDPNSAQAGDHGRQTSGAAPSTASLNVSRPLTTTFDRKRRSTILRAFLVVLIELVNLR